MSEFPNYANNCKLKITSPSQSETIADDTKWLQIKFTNERNNILDHLISVVILLAPSLAFVVICLAIFAANGFDLFSTNTWLGTWTLSGTVNCCFPWNHINNSQIQCRYNEHFLKFIDTNCHLFNLKFILSKKSNA